MIDQLMQLSQLLMQDQFTITFNLSTTMFRITPPPYVQSLKHGSAMRKMTSGTRNFHLQVTNFCLNLIKVERIVVALLWYKKASLDMKECPTSSQTSEIMECMELTTNFKGIVCNIYIVYHIPNTSVIQFCSKLSDLMESNVLEDHRHIIMLGDFNIHVDNPEHPDTIIFNDFLESFDLINFTTFATHASRYTLDLVITSSHGLIKSIKQGHFYQITVL